MSKDTKIFLIINLSIYFLLYLMEAYYAILIGILFNAFYLLVVDNKKYHFMKSYIESFF